MSPLKRVLLALAFAGLLGTGPMVMPAAADDGQTIHISGPGVVTHPLPSGNVLVITTTEHGRITPPRGADPSNWVTVGINEYNGSGLLLWTFSETVNWSWDGTQVLSDTPTSSASTSAPGWYVASQPTPNTYWDLYPTREGNYAQATFACCGPFPLQSQNPQIWITVDAYGGWTSRTQCSGC